MFDYSLQEPHPGKNVLNKNWALPKELKLKGMRAFVVSMYYIVYVSHLFFVFHELAPPLETHEVSPS